MSVEGGSQLAAKRAGLGPVALSRSPAYLTIAQSTSAQSNAQNASGNALLISSCSLSKTRMSYSPEMELSKQSIQDSGVPYRPPNILEVHNPSLEPSLRFCLADIRLVLARRDLNVVQ